MVVCRSLAQYTSHPHTPHHTTNRSARNRRSVSIAKSKRGRQNRNVLVGKPRNERRKARGKKWQN